MENFEECQEMFTQTASQIYDIFPIKFYISDKYTNILLNLLQYSSSTKHNLVINKYEK